MRKRNCHGSFIVETPAALWVLFVLFTIPMIDLATVLLRYTFVVAAAHDASHSAGKAMSYMSDISAQEASAIHLADAAARATAAAFAEVTVDSVATRILITNLTTRAVTTRTTPLTTPADTGVNLYEYETTVTGRINPLIAFNAGPFAGIPGLSAPVNVQVTSRQFCENTQGLMQ